MLNHLLLAILAAFPAQSVSARADAAGDAMRREVDTKGRVAAISMSQDRIGCLLSTGEGFVLDSSSGRIVSDLEGGGGLARAIALSPDGEWVAVAGIREMMEVGPPGANFDGPFLPQGAIGPGRGEIESGEENIRSTRYGVPERFAMVNRKGLTHPQGGFISVWNAKTGKKTKSRGDFPLPISNLAFDGSKVMLVDCRFNVYSLNLECQTNFRYAGNRQIYDGDYPVPQVVFDQNLRRVAALSANPSGKIDLFSSDVVTRTTRTHSREADSRAPWALALAPDGSSLVTTGLGSGLVIWDVGAGERRKLIVPRDLDEGDTLFVGFATDPNAIICSTTTGLVCVIALDSGRTLLFGLGPKSDVRCARLKGDVLTMVSGGYRQVGNKLDPLVIWKIKLHPPANP
jgi:WD40 repeat protein